MEPHNNNEKTDFTEPLNLTQPNPETLINTNPVEPLNTPKKTRAKKGVIYGVFFALILVSLIVIFAVLNMPSKNDSKTDAPQKNVTANVSTESGGVVIENIISDLRTKIIDIEFIGYDVNSGVESTGVPVFDEAGGFFVRLYPSESWALHLLMNDSSESSADTLSVKSIATNEQVAKFAADTLRSNGFEDYGGKIYEDVAYSESSITMLQRKDELCQVVFYGTGGLSIECVDMANLEAAATKLKPFYDAMFAIDSPEREKNDISVGTTVPNNAFPEYNSAEGAISVNGYASARIVFYQKNGGAWKFAYTAQSIKSCMDYNNDDVRKAFYSDDCVDDATNLETTVTEYYKL